MEMALPFSIQHSDELQGKIILVTSLPTVPRCYPSVKDLAQPSVPFGTARSDLELLA